MITEMAKYSTLLKKVIIWVVYPKLITVNLLVLSRISPHYTQT